LQQRFQSRERDPQFQRTRAAELLAQCRDDARAWRRALLVAATVGITSWGVGLYLVSWAVHTTDEGWGALALWSGLLIGNVGFGGAMVWLLAQADAYRN
jgi:hypothetical protein